MNILAPVLHPPHFARVVAQRLYAIKRKPLYAPKLFFFALTVFAVSCTKSDGPGESLGDYKVSATLNENTCGSTAFAFQEAFSFALELRVEKPTLYWVQSNFPAVAGSIDNDGNFRVQLVSSWALSPDDPEAEVAGCTLEQKDTVTGIFELSASPDAGLSENTEPLIQGPDQWEAEQSILYSPVSGSDCSLLLTQNGGSFAEIPCRLDYDLLGTRLTSD
ncbi:MAG: hypothetical protein IPJ88_13615 [Myxococcales bacterium]|nr:MAG: hypothetical protein IPJ88_13615 [Myxococcales bacterium]